MSHRRLILFACVSTLVIGCDHATKVAATALLDPSSALSLASGLVRLELVHNPGAFLSLGAGLPAWARAVVFLGLIPLSVLAASVLALRRTSSRGVSLLAGALLAGGGLANWLDRLAHSGLVTDFVSVGVGRLRTGIFNLADVAIVAGALLLYASSSRLGREPRAS
jgi:signal peptidase II